MEQEEAKQRLRHGATVLCLDVPAGTEFGIDTQTWQVGSSFLGVKMVPPGLHYVRYRSIPQERPAAEVQEDGEGRRGVQYQAAASFLPMLGFFAFLSAGQVLVRRWSSDTEELVALEEEEAERYAHGVRRMDFDAGLGPYPLHQHQQWLSLTAMVTKATVRQCAAPSHLLAARAFLPACEYSEAEKRQQWQASSTFRFPAIPQRWLPPGCAPGSETTLHMMDKSSLVTHLLCGAYADTDALLSELQFAFVAFWLAESFEAFEQWKALVCVLCSCEVLLLERPAFFASVILVLHHQLQHAPPDFFIDPISSTNFLVPTLRGFLDILDGPNVSDELREAAERFRSLAADRFPAFPSASSADFASDDEDAPTIVYL